MTAPSHFPILSSSLGHMFSYFSASFSDNDTCIKFSLFAALEARLSDLGATSLQI